MVTYNAMKTDFRIANIYWWFWAYTPAVTDCINPHTYQRW